MYKKLSQYYQIFCNLSFDVVIGVFFCMLPLPKYLGFEAPLAWYIALPIATWIIYTTDHFLDNLNPNKQQYSRHQFIAQNFKYITPIQVCLIIFSVVLMIKQFDKEVFILGATMSLVICIYFLIAHHKNKDGNWKDLMVAFIYSGGIYLFPFSLNLHYPLSILIMFNPFIVLLLTAFINLKVNSFYEQNCNNFKLRKEILILTVITLLIITSSFLLLSNSVKMILISYLAIIIGHIIMLFQTRIFKVCERYRKISEALFWLPGVLYFLV